jgi:hypothetical protein
MKCYVTHGRLRFIVDALSHKHAAQKALLLWARKYPDERLKTRTRVSEVGFEIENEFHDDDSIYPTKEIVSRSNK